HKKRAVVFPQLQIHLREKSWHKFRVSTSDNGTHEQGSCILIDTILGCHYCPRMLLRTAIDTKSDGIAVAYVFCVFLRNGEFKLELINLPDGGDNIRWRDVCTEADIPETDHAPIWCTNFGLRYRDLRCLNISAKIFHLQRAEIELLLTDPINLQKFF